MGISGGSNSAFCSKSSIMVGSGASNVDWYETVVRSDSGPVIYTGTECIGDSWLASLETVGMHSAFGCCI